MIKNVLKRRKESGTYLATDSRLRWIGDSHARGCASEINTKLNKLLIENKLIICALRNLHHKISREKFEPEPGKADSVMTAPPGKSGIHLKREI